MSAKIVTLPLVIFLFAPTTIAVPNELFSPTVIYDSGGMIPVSVVVADVNGDGKLDIVVANSSCVQVDCPAPSIGVLLGNGDGTFRAAVTYFPGGIQPRSVAVADVNGDGKPDLLMAESCATCSFNNGVVGVMFGKGDGTFESARTYSAGGSSPASIAVGDVNGDGKPDLVVTEFCGTFACPGNGVVGVLLGNGDGTFKEATTYQSAAYEAESLTLADVNGDGKLDVVVTNLCKDLTCIPHPGPGVVSVLLGNGDGTFLAAQTYASGGFDAWSLAIADVNGDGKPDLLVANNCFSGDGSCGNAVGVLLGNGDGTFQVVQTYDSGGFSAAGIAVGDVNGDGIVDLLVANELPSPGGKATIGVLLGRGDGTFEPAQTYDSDGLFASAIAVADLSGNGAPDVVAANEFACADFSSCLGSVGVLLNTTSLCKAPPVVTVSLAPTALWPANGKMVPVSVSGTISDKSCPIKSVRYAVTDEYGKIQPSGSVSLVNGSTYSFTVLLQASRLGNDLNGRLYTVSVSATNNAGATALQTDGIIVPHDQRH
jgi:hypothetical protein